MPLGRRYPHAAEKASRHRTSPPRRPAGGAATSWMSRSCWPTSRRLPPDWRDLQQQTGLPRSCNTPSTAEWSSSRPRASYRSSRHRARRGFHQLRKQARDRSTRLHDVAQEVVSGDLRLGSPDDAIRPRRVRGGRHPPRRGRRRGPAGVDLRQMRCGDEHSPAKSWWATSAEDGADDVTVALGDPCWTATRARLEHDAFGHAGATPP